MDDLPDSIQAIITVDRERPRRTWQSARHAVEFLFNAGVGGSVTVARFAADTPIAVPAVGQEFSLHRTVVTATSVHTSYQADENGAPVVYTAVDIALVD